MDGDSVGTTSFRTGLHVLPPGRHTMPHYHDVESAVYMVKTGAVVFVGEKQIPVRVREGDFLYIPAKEIHSAYNPSKAETHVSVVIQGGAIDSQVGTYERPDLKSKGPQNLKRVARKAGKEK